jgi:hypothetical protein
MVTIEIADFQFELQDTLPYDLKIDVIHGKYLHILSKLSDLEFKELCKNNDVKLHVLIKPINDIDERRHLTGIIYSKFKENFRVIRSLYAREQRDLCYYNYNKIKQHINIEPHLQDEYVFAIIKANMKNLTRFIGD